MTRANVFVFESVAVETLRLGIPIPDKMPRERLSVISGSTEPGLVTWTFNDVLREQCIKIPNNVAIYSQHQNEAITYAELNHRAETLAAGLYEINVRKGDRVGVLLGNRSEYCVVSHQGRRGRDN